MNLNYEDFKIKEYSFYKIEVALPKTNLLIVGNKRGYFMCGALDVGVFDSKPHLQERKVVCGRALGVKTIDELIDAPLKEVSKECEQLGIFPGMKVSDALLLIS